MLPASRPLRDRDGSPLWAALAVMSIAAVAFAAGLPNGRLSDDALLLQERLIDVRAPSLAALFGQSYWADLHDSGLYRPLALVALSAERSLFGLSNVPYHIVNLALHALCSLLALRLLRRFTVAPVAIAGALLFAAHPIHAEAVTTIYGQQDLLAALFFLISLTLYLDAGSGASSIRVAIIGLSFLASLLCKEQGILLPVLAAFLRFQEQPAHDRRFQFQPRDVALLLAFGLYICLRIFALGPDVVPSGDASVVHGYPWWARVNVVIVSVGTYLRLLVFPWGQTTYYGHLRDSLFGLPLIESTAILAAVALFGPLQRWLGKGTIAFAYAFLATTLLPVANVLPIGVVVAERCLYLPALAVSLVIAASVYCAVPARRHAPAVVAAALVMAGLVLSTRVAFRWRTPLRHWETTAADHPRSAGAHARFALFLLSDLGQKRAPPRDPGYGRADAAIERALQINPRQPDGWHARGVLALMRGDCAAAIPALQRALTLRPADPEIGRLLGACR